MGKRAAIAGRLLALLTADVDRLEGEAKDYDPSGAGSSLKARVEALGQVTRTLEKLLELKRLEALVEESASAEDEAETQRLRRELLRRLRAVDARRAAGAGLLDAAGAAA